MVQSENSMVEFNDLVCQVFGIEGPSKEAYKGLLWGLTLEKDRQCIIGLPGRMAKLFQLFQL